jgi:hypothetical protein
MPQLTPTKAEDIPEPIQDAIRRISANFNTVCQFIDDFEVVWLWHMQMTTKPDQIALMRAQITKAIEFKKLFRGLQAMWRG